MARFPWVEIPSVRRSHSAMSPSALCSNLINRMQLPNLLAKVVDCKPFGRASSIFGIAAGMSLRSASQQLPVAKHPAGHDPVR